MNSFIEYYNKEIEKHGGIENYVVAKAIEKRPLLARVMKYSKNNGRILEAGCGSATNSIYLLEKGFFVLCADKDKKILTFAKKNANFFGKKPTFVNKDIFDLIYPQNYFDVAYSHGVLEHFSNEDIIKLINKQLKIAKYVIFSVPSNFFVQKDAINGDERFLSRQYWRKLISKSNGTLIETFCYFCDSYNAKTKFWKLISKITVNKLPFKKPYIGFVIKNE